MRGVKAISSQPGFARWLGGTIVLYVNPLNPPINDNFPLPKESDHPHPSLRLRAASCIIPFYILKAFFMEAEHVNALTHQLGDLDSRAAELRRYL
ncbi:hypothetical protein SAMN05216417_11847 [Nitrosospira multiformis]|jgi:hypothetical protein|uniref:Uncharacterized protein n=1 Tax=Nitrosospira multiformis TaxID=1231 RepID=A0A1I7IE95_9PROT|nr:hypothetical protein SAMN05216417_11847 [Nitrosospira multiformis]